MLVDGLINIFLSLIREYTTSSFTSTEINCDLRFEISNVQNRLYDSNKWLMVCICSVRRHLWTFSHVFRSIGSLSGYFFFSAFCVGCRFFFVWSNPFTHCKNTFSKHTICTVHKSVYMRFVVCQHSLTSSWLDQWSTATKMFITHLAYRSSFRSCSFTEMHKIVLVCCF